MRPEKEGRNMRREKGGKNTRPDNRKREPRPEPGERSRRPENPSMLKGRLLFNMRGGGARLIGDGDKLLAWIPEGATGTGLHGDTVEARATRGDQALITNVLDRAREVIIGTYQKQKSHAFVAPDDPRVPFNLLIKSGGPELERPLRSGD